MFGDQFKMMGVETPVKQELGTTRVEGGQHGEPADVEMKEGCPVPSRKELLLMLASTVGEDGRAGLLSEQQVYRRAAYDAYGEQEVQVLCSATPRNPSFSSVPTMEEEFIGSSSLERDALGFYTEQPTPEKQLTYRYTDYFRVSNTSFHDHESQ